MISEDAGSRWFLYRDNRNNTAHDYGQNFADETLALIDQFISDVTELMSSINEWIKFKARTCLDFIWGF